MNNSQPNWMIRWQRAATSVTTRTIHTALAALALLALPFAARAQSDATLSDLTFSGGGAESLAEVGGGSML